MSRPTPILYLVLDQIHQGETRSQRDRRHEHSYPRVSNSLPQLSFYNVANRDTGRHSGEGIGQGIHVCLGTSCSQTVSRSCLLMRVTCSITGSYSTRFPGNTVRIQNVQSCFRSTKTLIILKPNVRLVRSGFAYRAGRCGTRVCQTNMMSYFPWLTFGVQT